MNQNRIIIKSILYLLILILFVSLEISAVDSTLVRIRTDVSAVNLTINDSLYVNDNFGNQISANNWFIISLTSGEHKFELQYEEQHFDTTIVIAQEELIVLEYSFLPDEISNSIAQESLSQIYITSNPDSGYITVDGKMLDILTPTFIAVQKDSVSVEVVAGNAT